MLTSFQVCHTLKVLTDQEVSSETCARSEKSVKNYC